MAAIDKADRVRAIFAAYLASNRGLVEAAFAEDFPFTSPYDDNIDKATYFEQCWSGSDWIERHELEKIVASGDEVFVTYRCGAKDGKSFRNTEFFVFDGDKVRRIDVYLGATYQNARSSGGPDRAAVRRPDHASANYIKNNFHRHVGGVKARSSC